MKKRAAPSGVTLNQRDAAVVKGMLARGDRQHDIAAWFGVNGGRVAEIANSTKYPDVEPAKEEELPPAGPYPSGRVALEALAALTSAKSVLSSAEAIIRQ